MTVRIRLLSALAAAVLLAVAVDVARAADKEIVGYRLKDWHTVSFSAADRAEKHHKTVKDLGCEVKQQKSGDKFEVTYRCSEWREMELKSHSLAHKWEKWLKQVGFETKHEH